MLHGIKISESACQGCVNCIKSCPTEAIRVIDGSIQILDGLCINCGECLRACRKNALRVREDDWELIRTLGCGVCIGDPSFFLQFGGQCFPEDLRREVETNTLHLILEEANEAFDLCAYASASVIENMTREQLPLISTYCPSVIRLIQLQFPELIPRLLPVENPLEVAVALRGAPDSQPVTLFSPCPARVSMVNEPIGREKSNIDYVVSVNKVVRHILASGYKASSTTLNSEAEYRSLAWAIRGGESKHIKAFSKRKITSLAVSGIRNTMDILKELELGKLSGIDFVECRMCDTGCIGGVATATSRFLAILNAETNFKWHISSEREERIKKLFESGAWKLAEDVVAKQRLPLSDNLSEAMALLKKMQDVHKQLPHIDCAACGRPSCRAMAEDIARGEGKIADCIFKLRENITTLADKIVSLASTQPHTLKRR